MTKKIDTKDLQDQLDAAAIALLKSTYGDILNSGVPDADAPPVNPNVFNAIVNWVRVRNKLEPDDDEGGELDDMINGLKRGKTRR